jgi:hypothetical protein
MREVSWLGDLLLAARRIARPDLWDLWLLFCLALNTAILLCSSLRWSTILGTGSASLRAFARIVMRRILLVALGVLRLLRSLLHRIAPAIGIMGHWILLWMWRHDAARGVFHCP